MWGAALAAITAVVRRTNVLNYVKEGLFHKVDDLTGTSSGTTGSTGGTTTGSTTGYAGSTGAGRTK